MTSYTLENFLNVKTPLEWLEYAQQHVPLLLVDHAHCERKAAATAIGLINRYCGNLDLITKMSKLAREELRHFEQVLKIIEARGERFYHLSAGCYAGALHKHVIAHEPKKLVDTCIVGAFIEARSCERFRLLSTVLEQDVAGFYHKLHAAEERHFLMYLTLAQQFATHDITTRIEFFASREAELIMQPDSEFRFHSGIPILQAQVDYSYSSNSAPSCTKSPTL